jgi:dolichyl-phosphate-mannose-protein mannosyltransferase
MKKYMNRIGKNVWLALVLLLLSSTVHFAYYGEPEEIVFDEVYFPRYASDYLTGSYYFDPHPPLGKMVIAGFGYLMGVKEDNTDYGLIGNPYPKEISSIHRFLPSLFATFIPVLIFFLCLELGATSLSAFVIGLLLILENSLVVHSRFTSLDSMLIFFGFSSILSYLKYKKDESKKRFLYLSAILTAFTFGIKWTGLAFPLTIVFLEIYRNKSFTKIFKFLGIYASIGIIFYLSIFAIHFPLLPNPGQGDAFMGENFKEKSFLGKFTELNVQMYAVNANMDATHQYGSKWYTWPFMTRTVFYWQEPEEGRYIYFIGNVFIYWLGTLSIVLLLIRTIIPKIIDKRKLLVVVGFLANWLPFILIGRVMFLYHYAAALIFTIISIGLNLEMIENKKIKFAACALIIVVATSIFIYFSPLTYGLPLSEEGLAGRMWFSSWR